MPILKGRRKKAAWILILAMLFTIIPPGDYNLFASHAVTVGSDADGNIDVTSVGFVKNFTGFDESSAILQVLGSNLNGIDVLFEINGELKKVGTRSSDSNDGFIKYTLSSAEAGSFTGSIRIAATTIRLVAENYPVLQSVDKQIVNRDSAEQLQMSGSNLLRIGTAGITATYGRGLTTKPVTPLANPAPTDSQITIQPPSDSLLGLQDIIIKETGITSLATGSQAAGISTSVQYNYGSAFRIIKNLNVVNPTISPNAAMRGETVVISAANFPASAGYQVYFLGAGETYSAANKSPSVVLSGDLTKLTVQVPTTAFPAFKEGTKTVKIVDTLGGEMIAEKTVDGTFNLIDASNRPVITDVAPASGTDSGSPVNIRGQNLLTPGLADLVTPDLVTASGASLSADKKELTLTYDKTNFLYQGVQVTTASRTVKVIIGAASTFEPVTAPITLNGDDLLYVRTASITDADTDPVKDVVVEMKTIIEAGGKTYVYEQVARLVDGYTFIPSSLKPTITKISPNQVHVTNALNMKENMLISIEGTKFMVNKWTDNANVTHVNYPVVVIQKTSNLGTGDLILMFDKNGNPAPNNNGRISYNDGTGIPKTLQEGGVDVPVDMVVLDANNRVVDGTVGNEVGTRIVLYLPKLAKIDAAASRNVKVLNPRRESDELGMEAIALDALTFIKEPPAPVIESVSPTIVTAGGGEEVTITGSTSIEEGAKVYIDGKEVAGVTRAIDLAGNKVLMKFKAPSGRLGKTQLAVINPGGGLAVRDFYYVQSFNKDPKITTVAPDRGTEGTLVVIGGDNFFKPDPSVVSTLGMDAYRLVGSRVLIDGVDVSLYNKNSYGEIAFTPYTSPGTNNLVQIANDAQGTPQAQAADYAHSVILEGPAGHYYTLTTLFDGTVRLTDGQQNSYTVRLNATQNDFVADKDGGSQVAFSVNSAGLTVDGQNLTMLTPYIVTGGVITGNKTRVISKNQIAVVMPRLEINGLKDVAVENPDTKRAVKEDSFTYFGSVFPQPMITSVVPNIGSVSGGYLIAINGTNFESGSQVYMDGLLVPAADTLVNTAQTVITIKVPKYSRNLADYNSDRITVPIVVVNSNAATASLPKGFTYVSPSKEPTLTKVQLDAGSTIGGEVVELTGTNFNYFESFKNKDGVPGYQSGNGDTFINLNPGINTTWDDLSGLSNLTPLDPRLEATNFTDGTHMFYTQYYASQILPKVYFGMNQAKIVSYGQGKIVVVVPPGTAGSADVYVVNNDSGISNKLKYTYKSSNPQITYMNPTQGARVGQENRDIYGSGFAQNLVPGYANNNDAALVNPMARVEGLVRFADITNRKIALGQPNDGKIGGGQQAIVSLEGNLAMEYNGNNGTIRVILTENGKTYSRTFSNYTNTKALIPAGMLRSTDGEYYIPNGYSAAAGYNASTHYELFLVEVDPVAGRFYVERGYAPRVEYDNDTHLNLDTPSYYTIGAVNATVFNPDGGFAVTKYTYRNPASKPTIRMIKPQALMEGGGAYMVEASVKGGITIEIKGFDFREGVKVYIDKKPMEVIDITTDTTSVPGETLEVIIARVPAGTTADIGLKFPLLVENPDGAIASSVDPKTLTSADKFPIYFIYRNPLSDPTITKVTPSETSIAGGNAITLTGTDFRTGATVIIGSKGGIPITTGLDIDPRGTYIKFTTPVGLLTLGQKDIQVVNADFGTGVKANGLKIISYPKITAVSSEDGASDVEWVSVEGGGKIRITGSGFANGARVIFGGTRAEQTASGTAAGLTGLWKNDKYFTVTDGVLATGVEFVNDTTLIVTAPPVTKEKDFTVTILNADTGISDGDTTVKYSVPVPSAPLNLKADVVEGKYIRIYGYTSTNFDYFEVYAYIGDNSITKLEKEGYKDFQYLTTTVTEPYRITKLDGLRTRGDSKVYLVLKAVNKYGPSNWSNIVQLSASQIEKLSEGLGEENFDGNLDVPAWEQQQITVKAQEAVIVLSKTDLGSGLNVDLTKKEYAQIKQFLVSVPEAVVLRQTATIRLNTSGASLGFNSVALNTDTFYNKSISDKIETYANVRIDEKNTQYSGQMLSKLPRGMKAISPVYRIDSTVSNNLTRLPVLQFSGAMDLGMKVNPALSAGLNAQKHKIYRYDSTLAQWQPLSATGTSQSGFIYCKTNRPGDYVVLGER